MKTVLTLQIAAGFLVSLAAGGFFGREGAISAGVVAVAVIIPNGLFALLLTSIKNAALSAMAFFVGEMLKIGLTAGLLAVFVGLYKTNMHWPSFVLSLIVVLQVSFLALWKRQDERK